MGGKPKSLRPKYPKPAKEGTAEVTVKPPKPVIEVTEDETEDTKNMSASKKRRLRKKISLSKLKAEKGDLAVKPKGNKKTKPSARQRKALKTDTAGVVAKKIDKATIVAKKIEKATTSSAKVKGGSPPKSAEKKKFKKLLKKEAGVEKMEVEVTKAKGKKKLSKKKNVK